MVKLGSTVYIKEGSVMCKDGMLNKSKIRANVTRINKDMLTVRTKDYDMYNLFKSEIIEVNTFSFKMPDDSLNPFYIGLRLKTPML